MPSMSRAPRLAQCSRRSKACAGQSMEMQRYATSPSSRMTGESQLGAALRHVPHGRSFRAQGQHGAQHLGDDVARLAHDDRVAHAHVLAVHLVLVVQRRARHGGAGHHHGIQLGHRGEHAGAAHLHGDVAQDGGLLFGRELERDGPARRAGCVSHGLLLHERTHLHHHAVDLVGQIFPPLERPGAEGMDRLFRLAELDVGVHVEAGLAQPLQKLPLAGRAQRALVRPPRTETSRGRGVP